MNDRDEWSRKEYVIYGIATAIVLAMVTLCIVASSGCKPPEPVVLPLEECPFEEPIDVQVAFRDACDQTPVDLNVVQIDGEEVERFLNDNDIYEFGCVEDESVHDVLALADGYVGVHNEPFRVEGGSLVVLMERDDGCPDGDDDDDAEEGPLEPYWACYRAELTASPLADPIDSAITCCNRLSDILEVCELCKLVECD